ncbi:F0F1 ATP synthase subunit A [Zhaonella formicivorans]|uniref:F0F1 ATP synthase subunit A n=1 Tax=Zhaonella formicivorans TaxID=2528593 RepID=UPI001D129E1C|nr:F0F1 ATP synthase subunit A [Zhaonella formicivorans]
MQERIAELANIMEHLKPHTVFQIGPIPVSSTVVNAWIVMAVLFTLVLISTRNLKLIPSGKQHFPEMIVEFLYGLLESVLGHGGKKYIPLVGSLFIFILFLNWAWFIPEMKPPTMDLSTTAAFGVTTIITVQLIGIKNKGLVEYLKHFLSPTPVLAPLNVIEELVKPVSLSLRLFGNMFGEEMVVVILFTLVPLFAPVPIQMLGVLMGFIQAFVFTLLTTTYIAAMVHGH